MDQIPPPLLQELTTAELAAVTVWWGGLHDNARQEIISLWDSQQDNCFFGRSLEDADRPFPIVIGGRFIPRDEGAGWPEWHTEYFDFLLCHPELVYLEPPVVRTFHICTSHQAARALMETGQVPSEFRFPLDLQECPVQTLLIAGSYKRTYIASAIHTHRERTAA